MAGTITALEIQKKNKERVNVYIDDQYEFSLTSLQAARLKRGQYLSDDTIQELKSQDEREKAYDRVLGYLAYRPRSQAEVRRYLTRKGLDESVIGDVIDRLTRANLLDDESFARFWVENRQQFRPRGVMALRYEMRAKGLKNEDISEALKDIDEEEGAYSLASLQAQKMSGLAPQEFRRRLGQYLARRGFPYSVITTVIRRLEAERDIPPEESDELD
jgi:regulatory protein